jgi:hypothetical protein
MGTDGGSGPWRDIGRCLRIYWGGDVAEPNWVVRAGIASAQSLMAGYRPHIGAPGLVGCSVQYAPGRTVEELARAGQFKNLQISYATEGVLQAALSPLGYRMQLVRSPGKGFHHTLVVLYDPGGAMLQRLPRDAAEALSRSFQRRPNPYPVP